VKFVLPLVASVLMLVACGKPSTPVSAPVVPASGSLIVQLVIVDKSSFHPNTGVYLVASSSTHLSQMETYVTNYYHGFYTYQQTSKIVNPKPACAASLVGYQDEEVWSTTGDGASSITSKMVCAYVFGDSNSINQLPSNPSTPYRPVVQGSPGCANPAKNLCTSP
jgi:hypothetical protein